jgi:ParB family chromosome partitioning protein
MNKVDRLIAAGVADTARASASPLSSTSPAEASRGGTPERYRGHRRHAGAALIAVDRIAGDPDQPRKEFDERDLARLAASIEARGVLQPILVRWEEGRGMYKIITGERRHRGAVMAGLAEIPAIVTDRDYTADELLELQLIENALREDLTPIDRANAYRRLMVSRGWSLRQVADELHVGHSSVHLTLSLLELPPPVQASVDAGELGPTVAAELAKLCDPADQVAVAEAAVAQGLKRAEVTELVQAIKTRRPAAERAPRPEPWTVDVGDGVTVTIRWKRAGGPTAAQALAKAARLAREREKTAG